MLDKKIIKFGSQSDLKTFPYIDNFVIYLNGNMILYKGDSILSYIQEYVLIDTMDYLYLSPEQKNNKSIESYKYGKYKKKLLDLIDPYWSNKSFRERLEYCDENFKKLYDNSLLFQKNFVLNKQETINKNSENQNTISNIFGYKKIKTLLKMTPYFYLPSTESFDKILSINKKINKLNVDSEEFLSTICLDKKIFLEDNGNKLIEVISSYSDQKYISLWIDDFSFWKQDATKFFDSIYKLIKEMKAKIVVMHGDIFFKILASNKFSTNIVGTITNNGYGESRSVFGEGGRNYSYFYLYKAHRRINYSNFEKLLTLKKIVLEGGFIDMEKYKNEICECKHCQLLLNNTKLDEFVTLMTSKKEHLSKKENIRHNSNSELIIKHFQYSKEKEYKEINQLSNKEGVCSFLEKWLNEIIFFEEHKLNNDSNNLNNLKSFISKIKLKMDIEQNFFVEDKN